MSNFRIFAFSLPAPARARGKFHKPRIFQYSKIGSQRISNQHRAAKDEWRRLLGFPWRRSAFGMCPRCTQRRRLSSTSRSTARTTSGARWPSTTACWLPKMTWPPCPCALSTLPRTSKRCRRRSRSASTRWCRRSKTRKPPRTAAPRRPTGS